MKKEVLGILFLGIILFSLNFASANGICFNEGEYQGLTADNPCPINNCNELNYIRSHLNISVTEGSDFYISYFNLTDNLDCSITSDWQNGSKYSYCNNASFNNQLDCEAGGSYWISGEFYCENVSGLNLNYLQHSPWGYYNETSCTEEGGIWHAPDYIGFEPIGNVGLPFSANFEGNGFNITGLFINYSASYHVGLFGYVDGANISDVNLVDVEITGDRYVGGLIGLFDDGLIESSSSSGNITGNYFVGGLVGSIEPYDENVSILGCSSFSNLSAGRYVGGLVGKIDADSAEESSVIIINDSLATGSIEFVEDGDVGGLIGQASLSGDTITDLRILDSYSTIDIESISSNTHLYESGGFIGVLDFDSDDDGVISAEIEDCYSTGNVDLVNLGNGQSILRNGGFIGYVSTNTGTFNISDSYALGNVTMLKDSDGGSIEYIGGFIGILENDGGEVYLKNVYSEGNVNVSYVEIGGPLSYIGGLIGSLDDGNLNNSYSLGNVISQGDYVGGLAGFADEYSEISNSYSSGTVDSSGDYVGGLVGQLIGTTTSCRYNGSLVSGGSYVGGLVGYHGSGAGGSSCPFAYSWNGTAYTFISDMSTEGKLGSSKTPMPNDYLKIESNQLALKEGKYFIKVTQEYDEIVYMDGLKLITIDHSPDYNVYNGLTREDEHKIFTVSKNQTRPLSCQDALNNDCLSEVEKIDGVFTMSPQENVSNTVTLNLGNLSDAENIKIVISYSWVNGYLTSNIYKGIQVKNESGQWVTIFNDLDLTGRAALQKTYVLNMTGRFLTDDYSIRFILPIQAIDYIGIDTSNEQEIEVDEHYPSYADLHYRGYSDYITNVTRVFFYNELINPFFSHPIGNFTRYGDVKELLNSADDEYVIMRHGDEISLNFLYSPQEEGLERSFLLNGFAYYKSATSTYGETVEPLPFIGMSKYPYEKNESYPYLEKADYLSRYNTREYENENKESHTIINCSSLSDVSGAVYIGGLVGGNYEKDIIDSYATGNVDSSGDYAGGLVGENSGAILRSYSSGNVNASGYYAGGLAGSSYDQINDSYSRSNVISDFSSAYVGGLVGYLDSYYGDETSAKIYNSYSTGTLYYSGGSENVGGLVGYADTNWEIVNSFTTSTIQITGDETEIGGLLGAWYGDGPGMTNSYWYDRDEGLGCYSGGDEGCTAIDSEEYFLNYSNEPMVSWNFNSVWDPINDSIDYPVHRWYTGNVPTIDLNLLSPDDESTSLAPTSFTFNVSVGLDEQEIESCELSVYDEANLLGLWHFDEDLNDYSTNENHGTANGGEFNTSDYRFGNASYYFNGSSYIDLGEGSVFTSIENFTVSAWVKITEFDSYGSIFAFGLGGDDFLFDINSNYINFYSSSFSSGNADTELSLNQWYNVVAVRNGDTVYFYLDGESDGQLSLLRENALEITNSRRYLGGDGGGEAFIGLLDEVAIWNRALSEEEISDLYSDAINTPNTFTNSSDSIILDATNIFSLDLEEGTYTWSVSCTDNLGVTSTSETRSLTVNATYSEEENETQEETTSSGSGYVPKIYYPGEQFPTGEGYPMYYSDRIRFEVKFVNHTLILNSYNSTTAIVTIQSDPIVASLEKGKIYEFDVDGDGINDVRVRYDGLVEGKARVFVQKIIEGSQGGSNNVEGNMSNIGFGDKEEGKSYLVWIILAIIVVIILAVYVSYKVHRKRRYYHHGY